MVSSTIDSTRTPRSLAVELFFVSLTSLFFELLVIRWLSCEFVSFSVFKTFPLVTCFVGLGVGVAKGDDRLFRYAPLALLSFVIIQYMMSALGFGGQPFPATGLYQWFDLQSYGDTLWRYTFRMMMAVVLLLMGPFAVMACIGSRIGTLFNRHKPLTAYCIDIAGAITGSIGFALLSFLNMAPGMQLGIVAAFLMVYTRFHCRPPFIYPAISLVASVVLALIPLPGQGTMLWSPYSRLDLSETVIPIRFFAKSNETVSPAKTHEIVGVYINSNHGFQQVFTRNNKLNLTPEGSKHPVLVRLSQFLGVRNNYYGLPYRMKSPKEILVLGAGAGSDVSEALRHGVEAIDGIEIDPLILEIGRKYNPDYQSSKVHLVCNDARDYVNRCKKVYDMVIFACLDSTTLSGVGSSMRTDSYIHTKDCYEKCLALLKPDGIFVLSFGASVNGRSEWLRDKIYNTIQQASGYSPLVISDETAPIKWPAYVFVSGEPVRRGEVKAPRIENSFQPVQIPPNVEARLLTDDWPYLYVRPIGLDITYLAMVFLVIIVTVYAGRHLIFAKNTASDGQLFALGAAFMLLELQAISRLSLLYGATWVTSSVVINGMLLMILGANFIIVKFGTCRRQDMLYAFLAVSLITSYFLPVVHLLALDEQGTYTGHIIVTFLTLLPVFIAGLIFATAFTQVRVPARSFAFNLLGSVVGALLEYLSTYFGINSLVLIALILYLVSYLYYRLIRTSGSTEPVIAGA